MYKEITCQSACNHINKTMLPYNWDLNPYRGCEHACRYCFAMYTHDYLSDDSFSQNIYIKKNIAECLERQLKSNSWKGEVINLGGITDCYQPCEEKYKLMPDVLKLLIKYKNPCIISSKSDLVLRDYDFIDELSRLTYVNVAQTITTTDSYLALKTEPGAVSPYRRFNVLKEFSKTNASTGLHIMPVIPFLTDSFENLDALFCMAQKCNVTYALTALMYLRGTTRAVFMNFISSTFPQLIRPFTDMYSKTASRTEYKKQLYSMINAIRKRYNIFSDYKTFMKSQLIKEPQQLSFFD